MARYEGGGGGGVGDPVARDRSTADRRQQFSSDKLNAARRAAYLRMIMGGAVPNSGKPTGIPNLPAPASAPGPNSRNPNAARGNR